jgi:hypothetical protein
MVGMKNYIARDHTPEEDVEYFLYDARPQKVRVMLNQYRYDSHGMCAAIPEWLVERLIGRKLKQGECVAVNSREKA